MLQPENELRKKLIVDCVKSKQWKPCTHIHGSRRYQIIMNMYLPFKVTCLVLPFSKKVFSQIPEGPG